MKRILGGLLSLLTACAMVLVAAAPASAEPVGVAAVGDPVLFVSPSDQSAGGHIILDAQFFDDWSSVVFAFDGSPLGTYFVFRDGYVSAGRGQSVSIPNDATLGSHSLTATGTVKGVTKVATQTINVGTTLTGLPAFTGPSSVAILAAGTCGGAPVYVPGGTIDHVAMIASPNASVAFSIAGRPGTIATVSADGEGNWNSSITLPADVTPGDHLLSAVINGFNTVTAPFTVSPVGTPAPFTGHDVVWHQNGAVTGDAQGFASVTTDATTFTVTPSAGFYVSGGSAFAPPNTRISYSNTHATTDPTFTGTLSGTTIVEATLCPVPAAGYAGLVPARLLETRSGLATVDGQFNGVGKVGAGQTLDLTVAGRGGVPASGVSAVVVNVTATNPSAASFITVFPSGQTRPAFASNLNVVAGQTIPNLVVARVGANGKISIYNNAGSTDVIVDVMGWFPTGYGYAGLVPARLLETRSGLATVDGQFNGVGKVGAGQTLDLTVAGRGGVPASGVSAVVVNVTATNPSAASFITVFPSGQTRPAFASNLNVVAGQTIPNLVVARVGANGKISIYNNAGSTDVIVDVMGWFPTGYGYAGLVPARLLETRSGLATVDGQFNGVGKVGAGQTLDLTVAGRGGVPASGVSAVVVNVTATNPSAASFITVFPSGQTRPAFASNLNVVAGQTIPNLVVARVGANGKISIYNNAGSTDVIVDVMGWYP